ncbi:MAG: AI-2E family transporter [Gammaproteobacteria bacterium]|nr:MAG: AI-2E family transporter [Gammaproteobacteria bacterium]
MHSEELSITDKVFLSRALEAAIRIGLVALLVLWCFDIIRPFIVPIIWGVIIAIAAYPGYLQLKKFVGGRSKLAAALTAIILLIMVLGPTIMLTGTLVESTKGIAVELSDGSLTIPPPAEGIRQWPLIGEEVDRFWRLASQNTEAALKQIEPQLKAAGAWLLSTAAGTGYAILQFIVAIIIAGVFMANAGSGHDAAQRIATRLTGEHGREIADLAESTVRSVARGILGVALIQSLLAGIGFIVAGVPGAGLWALLCLLLSVAQIGVFLVLVPVIIYLFNTADLVVAIGFLIWSIPVGLIDNILKPILLGRGVKTPMVIIFMGAIGGFIASGIIGLFIGAVVLALSWELFLAWLNMQPRTAEQPAEST